MSIPEHTARVEEIHQLKEPVTVLEVTNNELDTENEKLKIVIKQIKKSLKVQIIRLS